MFSFRFLHPPPSPESVSLSLAILFIIRQLADKLLSVNECGICFYLPLSIGL